MSPHASSPLLRKALSTIREPMKSIWRSTRCRSIRKPLGGRGFRIKSRASDLHGGSSPWQSRASDKTLSASGAYPVRNPAEGVYLLRSEKPFRKARRRHRRQPGVQRFLYKRAQFLVAPEIEGVKMRAHLFERSAQRSGNRIRQPAILEQNPGAGHIRQRMPLRGVDPVDQNRALLGHQNIVRMKIAMAELV